MKHKTRLLLIVVLSVALLLSTLSVQIYAESNEYDEIGPTEYLQYDYENKTITTY